MSEVLEGSEIGWSLEGIEPADDPAWFASTEAGRRAFWTQAGRIALVLYGRSRERGLDRFGRKLKALSPKTIKYRRSAMGAADPNAPPLIPAHKLSRTISLLRFVVRPVASGELGAWFYFDMDERTKRSWGEILRFHARGEVRGAPKRDVLGFSPREVREIRKRAWAWWEKHRVRFAPAQITLFHRWRADSGRIVSWMENPIGTAPAARAGNVSPYTGRTAGIQFTRGAEGRVREILERTERDFRAGRRPGGDGGGLDDLIARAGGPRPPRPQTPQGRVPRSPAPSERPLPIPRATGTGASPASILNASPPAPPAPERPLPPVPPLPPRRPRRPGTDPAAGIGGLGILFLSLLAGGRREPIRPDAEDEEQR